jgi:tellurite resistance protein
MSSERASDDTLWAALGHESNEAQRRAVVAAFASIAAADGTASGAELITFQARINASDVFNGADHRALWEDFADLAERLVAGDEKAQAEVETRIAAVSDDADAKELVIAAARLAIIADGDDNPREEVAMAHIARLLGVSDEALLADEEP